MKAVVSDMFETPVTLFIGRTCFGENKRIGRGTSCREAVSFNRDLICRRL